jgi:hypothetical protein
MENEAMLRRPDQGPKGRVRDLCFNNDGRLIGRVAPLQRRSSAQQKSEEAPLERRGPAL